MVPSRTTWPRRASTVNVLVLPPYFTVRVYVSRDPPGEYHGRVDGLTCQANDPFRPATVVWLTFSVIFAAPDGLPGQSGFTTVLVRVSVAGTLRPLCSTVPVTTECFFGSAAACAAMSNAVSTSSQMPMPVAYGGWNDVPCSNVYDSVPRAPYAQSRLPPEVRYSSIALQLA